MKAIVFAQTGGPECDQADVPRPEARAGWGADQESRDRRELRPTRAFRRAPTTVKPKLPDTPGMESPA